MKIWYDALTGKHVRYGTAIAQYLRKKEHETILTTRKHPDTLPIAKFLDENFIPVGQYNPKTLQTRLKSSLRRQLSFTKMFRTNAPDIAISHGSVDLCRVAFILEKPVICTVDAPHAYAVNKLTLPLSKYIVASKAIPEEILRRYTIDGEIVSFNGVDEIAWIESSKPNTKFEFPKPTIVVRQAEEKAAYTEKPVDMISLARKLAKLGTVVFLSRYSRKAVKGLVVPQNFVDSASFVGQADLFVSVGGTMAREAALQGTPAIIINVFQNQYVNDFLAEKGFPMFRAELDEAPELAEKLLGKKSSVEHLLAKLENPVDVIASLVERTDEKSK